ncbi:MAG: hypothetical protein ACE5HS_14920 [bacterium]
MMADISCISKCSKPCLLFLLIAGYFSTCAKSQEKPHLAPTIFAKIYTEMVLQNISNANSDSLDNLQTVLDKYEIAKEDFERSKLYFDENPEMWLEVFTLVNEELKKFEESQKDSTETR